MENKKILEKKNNNDKMVISIITDEELLKINGGRTKIKVSQQMKQCQLGMLGGAIAGGVSGPGGALVGLIGGGIAGGCLG